MPAARPKHRDHLDAMDAEALQEMLDSPAWKLVARGITNMREFKLRDLARHHTEVETATLRGEIEAFARALAVPLVLIEEAKRGGKLSA